MILSAVRYTRFAHVPWLRPNAAVAGYRQRTCRGEFARAVFAEGGISPVAAASDRPCSMSKSPEDFRYAAQEKQGLFLGARCSLGAAGPIKSMSGVNELRQVASQWQRPGGLPYTGRRLTESEKT